MNELVPHKSWMQRNRKWFIPLIGFILILFISFFSSGLGEKVKDISKAYADTALYENAITEVKKNAIAIQALGKIKPIDKMAITEGFVAYSKDDKKVKTTIRIKGEKRQGKLDIHAERNENSWVYKEIKIRIKGFEEPIIVVNK